MIETKTALYKKLQQILPEIGHVQKKGYNAFHKYSYAQEADILDHVRPLFEKQGLILGINCSEYHRNGELTTVKLAIKIIDADSGEEMVSDFYGEGQDKGDKGIYKAYTGAMKYFLMKTFLIPTGDDPEKEGDEERKGRKEENKQEKEKVIKSQKVLAKKAEKIDFFQPEKPTEPDTPPWEAEDKDAEIGKYQDYLRRLDVKAPEHATKKPQDIKTLVDVVLTTNNAQYIATRKALWQKCKLLINDIQLNDLVVLGICDSLGWKLIDNQPQGYDLLEFHKILEGMQNGICAYRNGKIEWEKADD